MFLNNMLSPGAFSEEEQKAVQIHYVATSVNPLLVLLVSANICSKLRYISDVKPGFICYINIKVKSFRNLFS